MGKFQISKTDQVSVLKRNGKWLVSRKCSTSKFETFPYYNLVQLLVWCRVNPIWHKTMNKQNFAIFFVVGVLWHYIDLHMDRKAGNDKNDMSNDRWIRRNSLTKKKKN